MSRKKEPEPEVLEGVPLSAEESAAQRSMAARVGGGVAGAVAGRVAGRALRPVARKAARRLGVPAESVIRIIEVATPVAVSIATAKLAKRKAGNAGKAGKAGPKAAGEAPGTMSFVPRQEPSAAAKD